VTLRKGSGHLAAAAAFTVVSAPNIWGLTGSGLCPQHRNNNLVTQLASVTQNARNHGTRSQTVARICCVDRALNAMLVNDNIIALDQDDRTAYSPREATATLENQLA
jgi:hypothetical protein